MWVAAAFARREAAEKVALALGRHGLGARAFTSGAEVLRQAEGLACVVCGARLQDNDRRPPARRSSGPAGG